MLFLPSGCVFDYHSFTRDFQGKRVTLLPKVIPLKLFLDMVPSSSADITRTMRGQPKAIPGNYPKQNGENVTVQTNEVKEVL